MAYKIDLKKISNNKIPRKAIQNWEILFSGWEKYFHVSKVNEKKKSG